MELKTQRGIRAYTDDGNIAAEFYGVSRQGDKLVIDGKALGVMRLDMIIPVGEVLRSLRLIFSWAVISFVLLLPYFGIKRLFKKPAKEPGGFEP